MYEGPLVERSANEKTVAKEAVIKDGKLINLKLGNIHS